jgi:hypothetical protein
MLVDLRGKKIDLVYAAPIVSATSSCTRIEVVLLDQLQELK